MQSVIEGMWNKVEHALKNSRKMAGKLEECSDSKVMKSVFNGMTSNIILEEVGFICFPSPMNFLTAFF